MATLQELNEGFVRFSLMLSLLKNWSFYLDSGYSHSGVCIYTGWPIRTPGDIFDM